MDFRVYAQLRLVRLALLAVGLVGDGLVAVVGCLLLAQLEVGDE